MNSPSLKKNSKNISNRKIESPVFADPTYDETFKKLLCSENKIILISFINDLVLDGREEVKELELRPNEIPILQLGDVKIIVDLVCREKNGKRIFGIESQRQATDPFIGKTFLYGARMLFNEASV
jgi:predicted transposase/invertase (TIGR01784 family)